MEGVGRRVGSDAGAGAVTVYGVCGADAGATGGAAQTPVGADATRARRPIFAAWICAFTACHIL